MPNIGPRNQYVDPNFNNFQDPNITLVKILVDNFGAQDLGSGFAFKDGKPHHIHIGGNQDFYSGGETPYMAVRNKTDSIGRVGIGSGKRYHHSKHEIWLWSRGADERWECVKELLRILQTYDTKPRDNIERIDIYNITYWAQPVTEGGDAQGTKSIGQLYRAILEVTIIWIR